MICLATVAYWIPRSCCRRQCNLQRTICFDAYSQRAPASTLKCEAGFRSKTLSGGPLRKRARKCSTLGPEHATFGDQSAHQTRRRHVETIVGNRRALGDHADRLDPSIRRTPRQVRHFTGGALFDRNPSSIVNTEIDGG